MLEIPGFEIIINGVEMIHDLQLHLAIGNGLKTIMLGEIQLILA